MFSATLDDFSWAEINQIGQSGFASKLFSIGDSKEVTIGEETIAFEIIGFDHDDLSSSDGKAAFTFFAKNVLNEDRQMHSQVSNVEFIKSSLYSWMTSTLLNKLPEDLISVIKTVKKKTMKYPTETDTKLYSMRIFLLSASEIYPPNSAYYPSPFDFDEGARYPAFTTYDTWLRRKAGGKQSSYWLRSPRYNSSYEYSYVVYGTSNYASSQSVATKDGVCFAFCI